MSAEIAVWYSLTVYNCIQLIVNTVKQECLQMSSEGLQLSSIPLCTLPDFYTAARKPLANVVDRVQALADISRSALCCHSNETRAPTANPPNNAQLEGTPIRLPQVTAESVQ